METEDLEEDIVQTLCGMREDDEDGESYTIHKILRVPVGWTDADIRDELKNRFPTWHCQHEYDCCGHFYPRHPTFVRLQYRQGIILVSQSFVCNI